MGPLLPREADATVPPSPSVLKSRDQPGHPDTEEEGDRRRDRPHDEPLDVGDGRLGLR
jgi:hypothetical protein